MARGLLFISAMCAFHAGCIVPVPLEQQPAQVDQQPVIISSVPGFGPITQSSADVFSFAVVVEDPDLQDQIVARLLVSYDVTDRTVVQEIPLPATDPSAPTHRSGEFNRNAYCTLLRVVQAGQTTGTVNLWVRASDRPFSDETGDATDGLYAESWWQLGCQSQ